MSWQEYVDKSLIGTGHIARAAICSLNDDGVWAHSENFTIKPEERKTLADIFAGDESAISRTYADGLYINGERFVMLRNENDTVLGRKEKTGVCVKKSKIVMIVAYYNENQIAGNATQTVHALTDYFGGLGY